MNVTIDATAERRLWSFIRSVNTEIGGWGYARVHGGEILWREVFLVPQDVSGSEVDFEGTGGDTAAVERAIEDGVLEDPSFLWVSWHSHHTMKPYWSKTDNSRIAAMTKTGITRLLSFVGCHDGDYRMRLDVFDVHLHDIALSQLSLHDLNMVSDPDDEFEALIGREVAANVKELKTQWLFSSSSAPRPPDDEHDLDVEEALAVRDLIDRGFTESQARQAVDELGIDGVGELIDSDELLSGEQLQQIGGNS